MNDMFMENPVFPLPFEIHLAFVCIAIVLFIFRYASQKRAYQLIMGIAIAATLLLYVNASSLWISCIGVLEVVLILAALISSVADSRKNKNAKKDNEDEKEEMAVKE